MPRYTLFASGGTPVRGPAPQPLTLQVGDWQLKLSAGTSAAPHEKGYVLTSVDHHATAQIQIAKGLKGSAPGNAAGVQGWDPIKKKAIAGQGDSAWVPEVDDEVLVVFQHGSAASHGAVFLHPGPMTRGSAQVQIDISPGSYRLRVMKAGNSPLSVAVATATDRQLSRGVNWQVVC